MKNYFTLLATKRIIVYEPIPAVYKGVNYLTELSYSLKNGVKKRIKDLIDQTCVSFREL